MKETSLAQISRDFLLKYKVYRYRMMKVTDMDDQSVIRACHWYCEENNLTDEFKKYRNEIEKAVYKAAHKYCTNNKEALLGDPVCGCFYCLEIFRPTEITEWIPETKGTAVCPYCGVDSVIGESSGFLITKEFLTKMHSYWFK